MNNIIKKLKSNVRKGFTLIELMIVIGIIGILAVIAIPQYTDYIARAQVTEGIEMIAGSKFVVNEFKATKGLYPTDEQFQDIYPVAANVSSKTKYVQTLAVTEGGGSDSYVDITVWFKSSGVSSIIQGKTMTFRVTNDGATWTCYAMELPLSVVPATCKYI